ncbi:MAG TPA: phosphatase PAP2 family protein [Longimicrobium sp.]|jgi:membrane-associated phospholipid phosphatase
MTKSDRQDHTGERRDGGSRALALGAVAVGAAAGFALLNAAVVRRHTAAADEEVRRRTASPRGHPARRVARAMAPAGKWWTYVPAALAASTCVLAGPGPRGEDAARSRRAGAGAVMLAGAVATALNPAFDRWLPQPPTPPGHRKRNKPVFPSGHAFGPGAVSLAAAYVLAREEIARPAATVPVALALPLALAGGRVLEEKHWASDVLGGLLGGLAVAAACLAAYEAVRGR